MATIHHSIILTQSLCQRVNGLNAEPVAISEIDMSNIIDSVQQDRRLSLPSHLDGESYHHNPLQPSQPRCNIAGPPTNVDD